MFAAGALVAVEDDQRANRNEIIGWLRLERRHLRDISDPFNLDPEYFRKFYRFPPHLALDLVDRLRDRLIPSKVDGIPSHLQVLCALRFYAEGSYQKGVGQDLRHPLSQTMVSRIILRVTNAIVAMADKFIQFPSTREDRQRCVQEFQRYIRIPGILGLIDCFLVSFIRPTENEEAFFNYKGFHAMNVQVVSDANYMIKNVRICPGSSNDRHVWLHSDMKEYMEMLRADEEITRVEGRYYLLGDSGYTPSPVLLTPIRNAPEGTPEAAYTQEHVQTRCKVEQVFGILTSVWRCIKRERKLLYRPEKVAKFIMARVHLRPMVPRRLLFSSMREIFQTNNIFDFQLQQGQNQFCGGIVLERSTDLELENHQVQQKRGLEKLIESCITIGKQKEELERIYRQWGENEGLITVEMSVIFETI